MLMHLVKKDILLIKKHVLIMMVAVIVLPLFIAWQVPEFSGIAALLVTVIYAEMILGQTLSVAETKYPKAAALLCASPYSRSAFIRAKYAFFALVFAYCCAAYVLAALVIPQVGALDLRMLLTVLLLGAVLFGIYMPVQLKFGVGATKYVTMITLLGVSFGLPALYKANAQLDLAWLSRIPVAVQCLVLAAASVASLAISMAISVRFFRRKEL